MREVQVNYEGPEDSSHLDGEALRRTVMAAEGRIAEPEELRRAVFASIKTDFWEAREKVKTEVMEGRMRGHEAARALSAIQDTAVRIIFEFAMRHPAHSVTGKDEHITMVATGGYGRGELAPGSDIDLLFIRAAKPTKTGEGVIEFILYMLWDLGLKVGHATRTMSECVRLAKLDITIRTALLEARYLAGDAALYADLRRKFWSDIAAGNGRDFVEAKLSERDERHRRQGESRYLVEPNIKEGKGGLRDLQTLYWIGKYLYHVYDSAELIGHGVFTREEYEIFQKAEAFLWDVRVRLHFLVGRPEERIAFEVQPALAESLGFKGSSARQAVEDFMRAYFLVAKDVGDLTRIFCAALEVQNRMRRTVLSGILPGFLRPRQGEDFFVETGRLNAAEDAFSRDPVNFIRIFHTADAKDIGIHPHALQAITRQLHLIDDDLRRNREANRLFLEVLCSRRDPERSLRRMNEAGVFGRFVPEFGRVVALMQFNMYHHYTVDEHLIRAIGYASQIEHGRFAEEHPIATDIFKRVGRQVIYPAMLMHDIAKGLPGDHSEVGATIAESLCPRLGLSAEDTSTVAWLVGHHLIMSDIAQRRDISDAKTVRDFVEMVQSPELLRHLLILTVADICAVGPGVWNGWKAQLLRELYYEAEGLMTGGDQQRTHGARVTAAKKALNARIRDLPEQTRAHLCERHYDSYWLAFDAETHERHARMLAAADAERHLFAFEAVTNPTRAVTEVAIYTPDHPGVFARISGAIAVSGGSIVDAKAFTTSDGFAFDIFSVLDAEGGPFGDQERLGRLKQTIEKTFTGEIVPRKAIVAKHGGKTRVAAAFKVPARVNFDNEASVNATVVEVRGPDRPGFLYDVATALFESGLSLSSAMIATYGERVVDVFYVRDGYGHKIVHPDRLKAIETRLLAAVVGTSAAD